MMKITCDCGAESYLKHDDTFDSNSKWEYVEVIGDVKIWDEESYGVYIKCGKCGKEVMV